jgi:hypothetical protein
MNGLLAVTLLLISVSNSMKNEPPQFPSDTLLSVLANQYREQHVFDNLKRLLEQGNQTSDLPPRLQVAFLKTHKTGSATMASVLFRLACRHQLRVMTVGFGPTLSPRMGAAWLNGAARSNSPQFDVMFQHITQSVQMLDVPISAVIQAYQSYISKPFIFTIVREPIALSISWLYYFRPPTENISLSLAATAIPPNMLCRHLGIATEAQLNAFLEKDVDLFDMICLTERFDECMVMLRRRLHWFAVLACIVF